MQCPPTVAARPSSPLSALDLDPMGAVIVSTTDAGRQFCADACLVLSQIAFGVILAWSRTIYHQFELLAGKSAPHEFLQLLIYNAVTFSDEIEKVDTVRAYQVRPFTVFAIRSS